MNDNDYDNLQEECDHYRRAFWKLRDGVAEFAYLPDPVAFAKLLRLLEEVNEK